MVGEARERGATVFLSSHVLSEVEHVCQRVGIIRRGQLGSQVLNLVSHEPSLEEVFLTYYRDEPAAAEAALGGVR